MENFGGIATKKKEFYAFFFVILAVVFLAMANIIAYRSDVKLRNSFAQINYMTNNAIDTQPINFSSAQQMDEAAMAYLYKAYGYYLEKSYHVQLVLVVLGIIFFISGIVMYLHAIMRRKNIVIIEEQIGKESLQAVSGYINIMKSKGMKNRKIREELMKMGMSKSSANYLIGVLK